MTLLQVEGLARLARAGDPAGPLLPHPVSFAVDRGRVLAVVGPSGAGKSTLLRLLVRLEEPTAGRVLLDGTPTRELPVRELRRRVGLVPQEPGLPPAPVRDAVLAGPRLRGDRGGWARGDGEGRARALVDRLGLGDAWEAGRDARDVSRGQRQRIALARTLLNDPDVLLLDEPTANLDPRATAAVEAEIEAFRAAGGAVVVATHDAGQADRVAGVVLHLQPAGVAA